MSDTRETMRPVVIDGAAGWFHPGTSGRGAVIVGAFGYEDLCSRVTLGALADGLAGAGLPTLRIDLSDTGDSADLPADADRIAAWIADTEAAVGWIRATAGVDEVVLIGLRIGALIATAAARNLGDVDRLVLMAPALNGRAHARELSILARLVDGAATPPADGAVEIAGFRLAPATLAALESIDLTPAAARPAREVILVGEIGSAALRRIGAGVEASGATVEALPFEGYARMMCDPTASEPALETVAALVTRLSADLPPTRSRAPAEGATMLAGDGWTEERMVFGGGLAGVLCRPEGAADPSRSAIWLNSGRNHHIGWARQTVDLSRRLARAGVTVLRMDLAGIGDSPARPGMPRTALYHDDGKADVVAAIDELERRNFHRPTVIGACSGAYQGFHTAVDERRIAGLVLINQLCFVWDASYAVHLSAWMKARPHEFEADARRFEANDGASAEGGTLRRLLRPVKRLARLGLTFIRHLNNAGSASHPSPIERRFREFSARGLRVSIVLSEGDRAVEELALHTGPGGARIAALPGVTIVSIADADHSLTPVAARTALGDHLVERLAAEPAPMSTSTRLSDVCRTSGDRSRLAEPRPAPTFAETPALPREVPR